MSSGPFTRNEEVQVECVTLARSPRVPLGLRSCNTLAGQNLQRMNFNSDNVHGVDEAILDALRDANAGTARAYGYDDWTVAAEQRLRDVFECDVAAFLVVTGTAANSLALDGVLSALRRGRVPPRGAHRRRRMRRAGALQRRRAADGRARRRRQDHARHRGGDAAPPSAAANTSSARACCHSLKPPSSARSTRRPRSPPSPPSPANGGCTCTWTARASPTPSRVWAARRPSSRGRPGVDVLSFGATKNGAMGVEAVVFFDTALATDFRYLRKRTGQLVSKNRFLAAQMLAYLDGDRWMRNARHANEMADRLAAGFGALPGVRLPLPVEANAVFAIVPQALHEHLQQQGARYLVWPGEGPGTDTVGDGRGVHPPADVVPHVRGGRGRARSRPRRSRPRHASEHREQIAHGLAHRLDDRAHDRPQVAFGRRHRPPPPGRTSPATRPRPRPASRTGPRRPRRRRRATCSGGSARA